MIPPFRLARLSPAQMTAVEHLEHDLNLTLVAWEPGHAGEAATEPESTAATSLDDSDLILDALVDDYRTHDPHL